MLSFLEILSGEHIAKDNYKCQRWVRMRIYLVIKATNCPLSFSHLQLFIISDLSQPDQLHFPWKMEREASCIQSQSRRNSLISRTHLTRFLFDSIPYVFFGQSPSISFIFLIQMNRVLQWIYFQFLQNSLQWSKSLSNHNKIFLRSLFSLLDSSDTLKFHIISSLHLIKYWQNLSIQIK